MSKSSPFEQAARAARVIKLLSFVPTAYSEADRENLAAELESWEPNARHRYGSVCGALRPSDETWRQFVAAVRARPLPPPIDKTPVNRGNVVFLADARKAVR